MEVSYKAATFRERIFAHAFDLMMMLITLLFLMWGTHTIVKNADFYKESNNRINQFQESTHLYAVKANGNTQLLCDFYTINEESEYEEYSAKLDKALTDFYSDPVFFNENTNPLGIKIYMNLKIPEGQTSSDLFVYKDETHTEIVKKSSTTYKQVYDFCSNVMQNEALKYVVNNEVYLEHSRVIALSFIFLDLLIPIVISSLIYELIIPLCFTRGKKTLGKLLFKLSIVDSHGLSISWKRYLCRYLLLLFFETLLSFISLFIPLIVSFTMYLKSKNGQCFHDYVTNCYVVEASVSSTCKTKQELLKKAKEDKDFTLSKDEVVY